MDCIHLPGGGNRLSLLLRPLGCKAHQKKRSATRRHRPGTRPPCHRGEAGGQSMFPWRTTRPPCKTEGRCQGNFPPPPLLWRETLQRRQSERHTNGTAGTCRREVLLPACRLRRRCGCGPGLHRTAPLHSVLAFPLQDPVNRRPRYRLGFNQWKQVTFGIATSNLRHRAICANHCHDFFYVNRGRVLCLSVKCLQYSLSLSGVKPKMCAVKLL